MSFEHKKSLGQNFLNSDYVPKKMCDAGEVVASDFILEIGPGTGALTKELLKRGAKVLALEADIRAIEELQKTFSREIAAGQLEVRHFDAREVSAEELGLKSGEFKVIANIPYYISGLLFRKILDVDVQPKTLVFLIQKEVAERIARDSKESLLSLSIKVFGDPSYISTIKKSHFTPPPKIDSAIIAVKDIGQEKINPSSRDLFFKLIHFGFAQKRKQLLGNLTAEYSRDTLEEMFEQLKIPKDIRAEDVPLEKWLELTSKIQSGPKL